jgi:DNA (cytosine-5)-methyltransferase 1
MTNTQTASPVLSFGSLFSGIGGFDLGFERAGLRCAWQCEIDPKAREVLRRHFNVEIFDDVKTIGKDAGAVDVICGGFPCQDVSIAGNRLGFAGERSGLWFEFARVIEELAPGWVVIENVPGLLSSNGGRDFTSVIQRLAQLGYGVAWRILDAQYFGVPQRRRRVFIVGSLGNGRATKVLFEPESLSRNTTPRKQTGKEVAFTLRASASSSGANGDGAITSTLVPVAYDARGNGNGRTVNTLTGDHAGGVSDYTPIVMDPKKKRPSTFYDGRGDQFGDVSPALTVGMTAGFGPVVMAHGQANAEITEDGSPALTANHEAPILFNGSEWRGVRRLTPVECARLQGFPDDWNSWLSNAARYKQYGNAVEVPVAEWIARRIVEAEEQ